MDVAVVRALTSHRCGLDLIPGPGVSCGLSFLLVLVPAPSIFLRVLRFSSLHKNQPNNVIYYFFYLFKARLVRSKKLTKKGLKLGTHTVRTVKKNLYLI